MEIRTVILVLQVIGMAAVLLFPGFVFSVGAVVLAALQYVSGQRQVQSQVSVGKMVAPLVMAFVGAIMMFVGAEIFQAFVAILIYVASR